MIGNFIKTKYSPYAMKNIYNADEVTKVPKENHTFTSQSDRTKKFTMACMKTYS